MKFKLSDESISIKTVVAFMIVAYLFSLSMRYFWVLDVQNIQAFHWNNELMINNNDGYYFAEGARDILAHTHQENDGSPIEQPISILTAFLAKILPISFETLILYMPAFIGSLIVIPLILIGRALNQATMGFIAALIGSVAYSYYNRTMTGYYDTDMFNIFFPVLEVYSLILAFTHQRNRYLVLITLSIALYQWWYPQAYALDSALFAMVIGYTLLFDRKNIYNYKVAFFMLIGILTLPILAKIALAITAFAFFHYRPKESEKFFWFLFAGVVILYFATGGITQIEMLVKNYLFHETASTGLNQLHYHNVIDTVQEAGKIPFSLFAERISGHTLTFIAAFIGYIMVIIVYRPLLITLPLAGLGFFALVGGLRFTIYAVPVMAIGLAYLILLLSQKIDKLPIRYTVLALLTAITLYPNYLHIRGYKVPTVLTNTEAAQLEQLGRKASKDDYVIAWWDYGFPIRYYSDLNTLIDGAQHNGADDFPVSFILTQPQQAAALMARLAVEYTVKRYETNVTTDNLAKMMTDYKVDSVDDLVTTLQLNQNILPKKTRDAYLYLPLRMMDILPTVALFSNLDPNKPGNRPSPFFFITQFIQDTGKTLELGQGISILKDKSLLKLGNQTVPIKAFYQVNYDPKNNVHVNKQTFHTEGLNVIYMASYGRFLVLDDYYMNSSYIQMFVLEQYDRNLFEPVLLSPMSKIFKLKV